MTAADLTGRDTSALVPEWVDHCLWWHVYPLGFTGAPIRTDHDQVNRFPHLTAWLDYAVELGTSGLILGPIFASSTHGYDSVDQFRIDPRLGTEGDFRLFLSSCKARGLRVILDGVFNHVGEDHPWIADIREKGPESQALDYLLVEWEGNKPQFSGFEGHGSLPTLNHSHPRVADYVQEVMEHWLEMGVDGWRLDAAYAVPTEFWATVLPRVRKRYPQAYFLGEVIHGDYGKIAKESTIGSLTQYELWKAIWSSLKDRNYYELAAAFERHNDFLSEEMPQTFIGNHDVTRIATQVGTPGAALALTVLLTVGGTPSIYSGDEQAYYGEKTEKEGGDDDVRPRFPATPSDLSELGAGMYQVHRELVSIRRRHPWLVHARTETVHLANEEFIYRSAEPEGDGELVVHLDLRSGYQARIETATGEQIFTFTAPPSPTSERDE